MAVITKPRAIGIVAALGVLAIEGVSFAPSALADPAFTISSPDVALVGLAATDAVTINITAPSDALIQRATIKLNGHDVTAALHPGAEPGSMTGAVSGLPVGANVFELFRCQSANERV